MFPTPDSDEVRQDEILADRVEALAAWIQEVDTRLRAAELTSSDQKTAKELRKAVEALAKHDPKLEDRLTNRVDVLKDRLATLADTVNTTSASLAARDGEMATLRRSLEAEHARLEALASGKPGKGPASAEVEELRKAVADLASERPKRRGGRDAKDDAAMAGTLEVLQQRLDMLAETVSTTAAGLASRDGDLAALKRRLDDDDRKVDAALDELRSAGVPLAELKLTVKEMSQEAATAARRSRAGLDGLTARVDAVAEKVDALAETASAASNGLAAGREELATLRGAFDTETGRLDAHVAKIEQYLASISPRMKALDALPSRAAIEALEVRVQDASGAIESFAGTLSALSQAVDETGQGYAERELELAALSRRFDEARSEVESLVSDVRAEVQALSEAGTDAQQEASTARAELAQALEQVTHRIDAVERERASSQSELEGALAASAEERETLAAGSRLLEERVSGLGEALEALSGRLEESGQGQAERDAQLHALSRRFEEGRQQVDALVSDLRTAIETMPAPDPARLDGIEEQVGELARRLAELDDLGAEAREHTTAARAELAQALEQVTHRIDAVERERASSQSELEGALAASAEERETLAAGSRLLEERVSGLGEALEALSGRLEESGQGQAERDAQLHALSRRFEEGRQQVDALVSDLRTAIETMPAPDPARLDGIEEQVGELARRLAELDDLGAEAREHTTAARAELAQALEQVTHRIDAVERERASSQSELEGALAASAEERETLAAGSRLLEERVSGLGEALEALSGQIDDGRTGFDTALAEVRSELTSLRDVSAGPELDARLAAVSERVETLDRRLVELAATHETSSSARAELVEELSTLRGSFDDETGRLDAHVARIEQALASLEPQLAMLDELPSRDLVEGLEGRVEQATAARAELAQALEQVTHRIDAVERERASQSELEGALAASAEERETLAAGSRLLEERVSGLGEALEALSGRIGVDRAEVDALVAELRATVETVPAADPAQATRVEVLAQAVEAQAATVADASTSIASAERELAGLRGVVDVLAGRLDDLGTAVSHADGAPDERYAELIQRIDALAATVESRAASKETDLMLGKVLLRLDALERDQQSLTTQLGEAAGAGSSEDLVAELRLLIENARTRIELLELAAKPSGSHVEPEQAQVVSIRGDKG